MGVWEWACPKCGQAQKSRNGQAVNTLCAACLEAQLAEEEAVTDEEQKEADREGRPARARKKNH